MDTKMKVLILQEAGRNPPNAHMRECYAIQRAFIANGWSADVWGLGHSNFSITPNYNEYNLIFCLENYSTGWLPDFSKIVGPKKCQWIIDLHCAPTNYQSLSQKCDYVLHSTQSLMGEYAKHNSARNIWFPNGVDDLFFYKKEVSKEKRACFIASPHHGRRELANYVGAEFKTIIGQLMIDWVSRSLVHFNVSIGCDVNYRCWETAALGTALVTNYIPEMAAINLENV